MKYEKPRVEEILTDEEDVIRTSPPEIAEDDPNEHWSPFFQKKTTCKQYHNML